MKKDKLKLEKIQITKLNNTQKEFIKGGQGDTDEPSISTNRCTETNGGNPEDRVCLFYSILKW